MIRCLGDLRLVIRPNPLKLGLKQLNRVLIIGAAFVIRPNPLKQGLKLNSADYIIPIAGVIRPNPLKQGLKLEKVSLQPVAFLVIRPNPLKQGLKLANCGVCAAVGNQSLGQIHENKVTAVAKNPLSYFNSANI